MDRFNGSARLMIVSDLDHTMVDHHDTENLSLLRFNALWESEYRHDSLLVFSTGRSPTLYKELRKEKPMLTPDITIMSVGTEITYGEAMVPDEGWEKQRPHKVSFNVHEGHADDVQKSLLASLENHGLKVKIIYSGSQDLDILPEGAGKGQALAYLLKKLKSNGRSPLNTLACGDSGNDAELFTIPEVHGVMQPKNIHATERCAAGIIEAIGHFNLGPNLSPRDVENLSSYKLESFSPGLEIVKLYILYERWLRGEMGSSELIQNLKAICHPSGVMVHPSGIEKTLQDTMDALEPLYGHLRGDRSRRVWVDKVSLSQICSDAWLVKFDKWESSGGERRGCVSTVLLKSKPEGANGFELVHVHETWLDGQGGGDGAAWAF
ncbi:unnamed protein product [Spirodela intermedia]|uniref:Uncharacterized protein n=1 Tax=Spirodela intermedia TaxID=51605 RepID=A0A7I8IXU1_SPIIN|nr:unnamed protein product [Spirodela intermedia]CAA6662826.1 unnamed protein product [Spirodela intermedia]